MDDLIAFGKFLYNLGGPLALALAVLILYLIILNLFPALLGKPLKQNPDRRNPSKPKSQVVRLIEEMNELVARGTAWPRWLFVYLTPIVVLFFVVIIIINGLQASTPTVVSDSSTSLPTSTPSSDVPTATLAPQPLTKAPAVSLLSVSYSYDGWDPRIMDLRTASSFGISAKENTSLSLFDFWASSSENLEDIGYQVKAEIYAGNELIGETTPVVIRPGTFPLGEITIRKYANGSHPESFVIQKGWEALSIRTVCFSKTEEGSETFSKILLTSANQSFLISPPTAHFISVSFSVNDEAPRYIDLGEASTKGIGVHTGATLEIKSIRVRTSMVAEKKSIRAAAYIHENGWEQEIYSKTAPISDYQVSLPLDPPMRWEITNGDKALVITLYRDDNTVLDSYTIPLKSPEEVSLVDYSSAVVWPFDKITYLDFEKYAEVKEWQPADRQPITLDSTTTQAFSGHRSMAIYLNGVIDGEDAPYKIFRNKPFQSDLLIGQVYWPSKDGITIPYAALCIGGLGHCFDLPPSALIQGRWNTFYIDLAATVDKDNQYFNRQEFSSFYFQADVRGIKEDRPYIFFLDGFQIFPSTFQE